VRPPLQGYSIRFDTSLVGGTYEVWVYDDNYLHSETSELDYIAVILPWVYPSKMELFKPLYFIQVRLILKILW
jgi:hypothetical protein